jgi:hypothetical protein
MMTMHIEAKCQVSQDTWMEQISEDETVELHDRHPTLGAHVDGADDDNIAQSDAAFPDVPLQVRTPRVWLAIL